MKKLTKEFLIKHEACSDGLQYAVENLIGQPADKVINHLIDNGHADWANWYIVRIITHKQRIMYAIFAAEQVISNYESKYPGDDRPRKAIEAARNYLNNPSAKNKAAADSAADSARSAAYSAAYSAARSAADSAVDSARSAADSAARSAAYSARSAAYSAADSAMQKKILQYGLTLIK